MKTNFGIALLILGALCGCESEVRQSAQKVSQIIQEAQKKPESIDALHELAPYLNHDSPFVRATACQAIGEIYGGTQDEDISARCATILCERLDDYERKYVAKDAARALLKIGLPSGHPDTKSIERKLCNAAKDLIEWDASWYAIEALAVIENPSDETFETLVHCFRTVHIKSKEFSALALARFGSRARFLLPELKEVLAATPPSWDHREISAAIKTIEEAVAKEDADFGGLDESCRELGAY